MKHSIRIITSDGYSYLSHLGKTTFFPAYARKLAQQYRANHPGAMIRIEDPFREPVETVKKARLLILRARRIYSMRIIAPHDPRYRLADRMMDHAMEILDNAAEIARVKELETALTRIRDMDSARFAHDRSEMFSEAWEISHIALKH